MAQARYWLWAASSWPTCSLRRSTKRDAGTGTPPGSTGSGGLDQLALLDRIALRQRALLEHADRTALAALVAHAARGFGLLALGLLALLGHGAQPSQSGEAYLTDGSRGDDCHDDCDTIAPTTGSPRSRCRTSSPTSRPPDR